MCVCVCVCVTNLITVQQRKSTKLSVFQFFCSNVCIKCYFSDIKIPSESFNIQLQDEHKLGTGSGFVETIWLPKEEQYGTILPYLFELTH